MILTIDIGNSNVCFGIHESDSVKPLYFERVCTDSGRSPLEYAGNIKCIFDLNNLSLSSINGVIMSSVVPAVSKVIKDSIRELFHLPVLEAAPGLKTGLNIKVQQPSLVGCDRICDAVGAVESYPLPLIVFDLGTATVCSVIDESKNFCGGIICPGVNTSLNSLKENTSQLPSISLETPKHAIGKNTIDCMKSGIVFGTAGLVDGLISRIESDTGKKHTVVATGGMCKFIIPHCRHQIIIDESLLLKGLLKIYKNNESTAQALSPGMVV